MAYGSELFLGFAHADLEPAARSLGLSVDWEACELMPEARLDEIDHRLAEAYVACLHEMRMFTDIREIENKTFHPKTFHVQTPLGPREMSPWRLTLEYDPHEMSDEPEDAVFGISLISRYKPCFLDWREPHGGSGMTICLDKETNEMIEIARTALLPVLPTFSKAYVCIKEIFY